ncbi:chemotaxis protein CheW [Melaminivora suipulveris]|uniref:Chemotaxis protein CheW n=1 Tax=Melaminivora suipulveris TaxID=2109913 RepID=A0A2R3QDT2_9BURK|nr:chemotaxis protein CheW [Melaminivora suipulveris]AVO49933.1 chemotaxis protein CheW [Melaminivora suipulveris]
MANREALKELQTRLAARLQAARSEGVAVASWLAAESAGQRLLLPLAQAGEIFPWSGVQRVPYTQPWFLGVANLRGALSGVIDLAALLGAQPVRSEQALAEASVLSLGEALEVNAALLVERLAGLRSADAFVASEPPAGGGQAYFGPCYIDAQDQRWQEIDLQALARDPAFLAISS